MAAAVATQPLNLAKFVSAKRASLSFRSGSVDQLPPADSGGLPPADTERSSFDTSRTFDGVSTVPEAELWMQYRLDPHDLFLPAELGKFGIKTFEARLRRKGVTVKVAVKRLPVGREVGGEYIWLQHEMQQKMDTLMTAMGSCLHMSRLYGHCIKGRELYVVMKHYERSLQDVLDAREHSGHLMSVHEACHIGLRIAAGLQSLHNNGIQHWDVTPAHVLMDEHGSALLAACGIERKLMSMLPHSAQEGECRVSRYGAPEAVVGGRVVVGWSADVWSLAAIMTHALSGKPPYAQLDQKHLLLSHSLLLQPPALPTSRSDVPGELLEFLRSCFNFKSMERPNAADAVETLLTTLKHAPGAFDPTAIVLPPPKPKPTPMSLDQATVDLITLPPQDVPVPGATSADDSATRASSTELSEAQPEVQALDEKPTRTLKQGISRKSFRDPLGLSPRASPRFRTELRASLASRTPRGMASASAAGFAIDAASPQASGELDKQLQAEDTMYKLALQEAAKAGEERSPFAPTFSDRIRAPGDKGSARTTADSAASASSAHSKKAGKAMGGRKWNM